VNISPLDIRKHEFRKVFRGYDPDEVAAFLDMVSIELENLVRENAGLKDKVANIDSQLKKYLDIEGTLRETLLSAQRAREETINTAKKHADVIIREAEVKAASIIEEGRGELSGLRRAFQEMRVQKENYLVKIKAMIGAQLDILDNIDFLEEKYLDNSVHTQNMTAQTTGAFPEPEKEPLTNTSSSAVEDASKNPLDDPSFDGEGDEFT